MVQIHGRIRGLGYYLFKELWSENVRRCMDFFLNGFSVWELLAGDFFYRIGKYLGHGLCYEVAALMMIVYRSYPGETRLVFADCKMDDGERTDHAWMEFKTRRAWWVIDPAWDAPRPRLRFLYRIAVDARYERIVTDQEFWQNPITGQFWQALRQPRTSYLFHELWLFRRTDDGDRVLMEWEKFGISDVKNDGKWPNLVLAGVYSEQHPVTQRIIRDYVSKESRLAPKKRSYRNAKRIDKLVREAS